MSGNLAIKKASKDVDSSTRMRSSIACRRCRRSKIKCHNAGHLDSACDNCVKSGSKCEWPDPTPLPPKRSEPTSGVKFEREPGSERKRVKKLSEVAPHDSQQYAEDILSADFIDRNLWDKIFVTYKRHFATELPFLHIPTLKDQVYGLLKGQKAASADLNLVLLGLLTLTARYHTDLVKYIEHLPQDRSSGPRQSDSRTARSAASAASEFFANALDKALCLGSVRMAFSTASVERVQACLMLGLHEWMSGNRGGLRAWMLLGTAVRMAQALKLSFGDKPSTTSSVLPAQTEEAVINREVKRRTMFSCFIMDRLLSCGKERVTLIRPEDLQVQLPCTEEDFDLTRQVRTGFLRPAGGETTTPAMQNPNVLSRFVQLMDLWGDIAKYSFAGGRLMDSKVPPWDPSSRFCQLRRRLDGFSDSLQSPSFLSFGLSRSNYFKHDNRQGSSTYVALHMLMSLCRMMLHREYVPHLPIQCEKPAGPIDAPTFPPDSVPHLFWENSAKELFRAANDVVDLIDICGDKLPHSSLAVFVIWTTAFVAIYANHFPQMDFENLLVGEKEPLQPRTGLDVDSSSSGAGKATFDALVKLSHYSSVASARVNEFQEGDAYFSKMVTEHHRNAQNYQSANLHGDQGPRSFRMGGNTGGLEEWVKRSGRITSNGSIMDEDNNNPFDDLEALRGNNSEQALPASNSGPEEASHRDTGLASLRGANEPFIGTAQQINAREPGRTPDAATLGLDQPIGSDDGVGYPVDTNGYARCLGDPSGDLEDFVGIMDFGIPPEMFHETWTVGADALPPTASDQSAEAQSASYFTPF